MNDTSSQTKTLLNLKPKAYSKKEDFLTKPQDLDAIMDCDFVNKCRRKFVNKTENTDLMFIDDGYMECKCFSILCFAHT